jgi:hypothetical protein
MEEGGGDIAEATRCFHETKHSRKNDAMQKLFAAVQQIAKGTTHKQDL